MRREVETAKIDISAVINGHREGLMGWPSLMSLERAVAKARADGISVEIIAVLDRPDSCTKDVFEKFSREREAIEIIEVDFADLGHSRNKAVRNARGDWVAFLDGDDLWGESWLSRAYAQATADERQVVWHPEINVLFGRHEEVYRHMDMEEEGFTLSGLAADNYWSALSFTSKEILASIPYRETRINEQFGYEDWTWNIDTIEAGVLHKIVPHTLHAIRLKQSSLVLTTANGRCMPGPTTLFRDALPPSGHCRD